ncbi:MAG: citrate lyase subunit beta / citryl-CoA lyase [Actinomycetota bacterium]|nr:citrate lyase subunit beta / citryl-CoA lyase [Actinomycetota bacterium]MDQ1496268.1 citrate lyase subunit beta / citryl-CoA lyase [Actinomycetota bacterium]
MTSGRWCTLLFAPADRPDRVAKAFAAEPDGVIVDLEDAVQPDQLAQARVNAAAALHAAPSNGPTRIVRVHSAQHVELTADLDAVVGPALDVVMLPKTRRPRDVEDLDAALSLREQAAGFAEGAIGIMPVLEDCYALRWVFEIATASERVSAMGFAGAEEGDFMADLGGRWTPDGLALQYAKSRFVSEVRAAGDVAAIDGPCMHLDSPEILDSECALSRTLGFDGKVAVHPRQIPAIRLQFVPSSTEVERATQLLEALERAAAAGAGVVRHQGMMVDSANARSARRTLARAGRAWTGLDRA